MTTEIEQPLHIHCDEHIRRVEEQNEGLRAALAALLDEFGARLSDGKPLGYTVGSVNRCLELIRAASAALAS